MGLVRELVEILVRPVHSTVQTTLFNVESLHHFPVFPSLVSFPNLLERLSIKIPNVETTIKQMSGASKHIAISHRVNPEIRRSPALIIGVLLADFLRDGVSTIDHLEGLGGHLDYAL